jgi:hypothetical protein
LGASIRLAVLLVFRPCTVQSLAASAPHKLPHPMSPSSWIAVAKAENPQFLFASISSPQSIFSGNLTFFSPPQPRDSLFLSTTVFPYAHFLTTSFSSPKSIPSWQQPKSQRLPYESHRGMNVRHWCKFPKSPGAIPGPRRGCS